MQEKQGEAQALLQELCGDAPGCTDTSGTLVPPQVSNDMNSPLPVKEQYEQVVSRLLEHKAELKRVLQEGGVPLDAIRYAARSPCVRRVS